MFERKGQVYMLKNLTNNKVYVGSTSAPLEFRIQQHMTQLAGGYHKNKDMQADYNKGHKFTACAIGEKRLRSTEEMYWMKVLRTYDERFGYNNRDLAMNPTRRALGLSYRISPQKGRHYKQIKEEGA